MPISVRDIQEKEFSRQKRDGYNIEEVDDFLDEISDQLSVLIRENMALAEQEMWIRYRDKTIHEMAYNKTKWNAFWNDKYYRAP